MRQSIALQNGGLAFALCVVASATSATAANPPTVGSYSAAQTATWDGEKAEAQQAYRAGASDFIETIKQQFKRRADPRVSSVLEACLQLQASFDCSFTVAKAAALTYRNKAHEAEGWSDAASTTTTTGLLAALIAFGHQASTNLRIFTFIGGIPIVTEDNLEMRPRARLYLISAMAMEAVAQRYNDLRLWSFKQRKLDHTLTRQIVKACVSIESLSAQTDGWPIAGDRLAAAPQLEALKARCALLSAAETKIDGALEVLPAAQEDLAGMLAFDATLLDDHVALLDRDLRASPEQAFRYALAAPFTLVGKVLAGTSRPSDLSDTALATFGTPLTLHLWSSAKLSLPNSLPDPLILAGEVTGLQNESLKTIKAQQAKKKRASEAQVRDLAMKTTFVVACQNSLDQLNELTKSVTMQISVLEQVNAVAYKSVLKIDFKANDEPVSLTAPKSADD